MSFFRKVASAFVVIEEGAPKGAPEGATPADASAALDDIAKETSSLLAQLEGAAQSDPATISAGDGSIMDMTAEDVFRAAQLGDSPNSALRVIKLVAGLSMFSREQQLAMVRAMDAADDSWSEADVAKDAQQRQKALRDHLTRIAQERAQRMNALAAQIDETRKGGEAVLAELDKRIAELYARREQESAKTATDIAKLEQSKRELEARESRARQGVAQVIQALSSLLSFLGISQTSEPQ